MYKRQSFVMSIGLIELLEGNCMCAKGLCGGQRFIIWLLDQLACGTLRGSLFTVRGDVDGDRDLWPCSAYVDGTLNTHFFSFFFTPSLTPRVWV